MRSPSVGSPEASGASCCVTCLRESLRLVFRIGLEEAFIFYFRCLWYSSFSTDKLAEQHLGQ